MRPDAPKLLTEEALDDKDMCTFLKGWAAVVAPFLMTFWTDLTTDLVVLVVFLAVLMVVEVMERTDGKEQDEEWTEGEECNDIGFWQPITWAVLVGRASAEAKLIYQRYMTQRLCGGSHAGFTAISTNAALLLWFRHVGGMFHVAYGIEGVGVTCSVKNMNWTTGSSLRRWKVWINTCSIFHLVTGKSYVVSNDNCVEAGMLSCQNPEDLQQSIHYWWDAEVVCLYVVVKDAMSWHFGCFCQTMYYLSSPYSQHKVQDWSFQAFTLLKTEHVHHYGC